MNDCGYTLSFSEISGHEASSLSYFPNASGLALSGHNHETHDSRLLKIKLFLRK